MISLNKLKDKGYKRVFSAAMDDRAEKTTAVSGSIDESDIDAKAIGNKATRNNEIVGKKIGDGKIDGKEIDGKEIGDKKIAGGIDRGDTAMSDTAGSFNVETEKGYRSSQYAAERVADRGQYEYMQYIHGFIGCVLVLLALIHIPFPEPFAWLPYSVAAVLALITLKSELSLPVSRVLAIATAGMMFFLFALFFLVAPTLKADWYMTQYGWAAVCLILSAFMMIPILSEYSCRLKADCMEARAARRTAFFSVPSNIRPESR